jgi:hypothetical protein
MLYNSGLTGRLVVKPQLHQINGNNVLAATLSSIIRFGADAIT